jgi:rare lipoprotein A
MATRPAALAAPLLLLLLGCAGCVRTTAQPREPRSPATDFESTPGAPPARADGRVETQEGYATWYGGALAGHLTANGERFDPSQMTAAHRTLPFGTWVEVTRLDTGQTVRVRINDRGPFGHEDRIIDLSRGAAEVIGLVKKGVGKVLLRVVDGP